MTELAKMGLRVDALNMVHEYCEPTDSSHMMLAHALGFEDWEVLRAAHGLEIGLDGPISCKLRMLAGDHSYTIYKALLACLDEAS